MRTSKNERTLGLEQRLLEVRRDWSPEVYRRRRQTAAALQQRLIKAVVHPVPQTQLVPQAG